MQRFKAKLIFFTLGMISPVFFQISKVNAGSFGAEIFCMMRDGGNNHESSWEAAYTYIKKQKGGIFKVSPRQAATQITEAVIRNADTFGYCVQYLDQLHPNRKLQREEKRKEKAARDKIRNKKRLEKELEDASEDFPEETLERYSY